jgi:ABC-type branched-subunit amino acid transport system permease subunit
MQPHRGIMILVFGILSFVVCPFFGIAAWVMGNNDLQQMNAGRMDSTGRDLTNAGRICGMVSTALLILPLLVVICAGVAMLIFGN